MRRCDPRRNHDEEVAPSTSKSAASLMYTYKGNEAHGVIITVSSPETNDVVYARRFVNTFLLLQRK